VGVQLVLLQFVGFLVIIAGSLIGGFGVWYFSPVDATVENCTVEAILSTVGPYKCTYSDCSSNDDYCNDRTSYNCYNSTFLLFWTTNTTTRNTTKSIEDISLADHNTTLLKYFLGYSFACAVSKSDPTKLSSVSVFSVLNYNPKKGSIMMAVGWPLVGIGILMVTVFFLWVFGCCECRKRVSYTIVEDDDKNRTDCWKWF